MRFLISVGTLCLLTALARYILFTMASEWCNDLDNNYTTCEGVSRIDGKHALVCQGR